MELHSASQVLTNRIFYSAFIIIIYELPCVLMYAYVLLCSSLLHASEKCCKKAATAMSKRAFENPNSERRFAPPVGTFNNPPAPAP
jgi:hypothetical protein